MSYQQKKFREIADKIREYTDTSQPIAPKTFALKIDEVAMVQFQKGKAEGGGGETLPDADVMEFPLVDGSIGRVSTDSKYYDEIAVEILSLPSQVTPPFKPSQMADAIGQLTNDVYKTGSEMGKVEGRKAQYDEFWDTLQENGAYKSYQYAFGGGLWSDATFQPKHPLNGTSFFRCFAESDIKTIDKTIDLTKVTGSTSMQNMFNNAKIETIRNFYVSENTTFHNTAFNGCTALVTLNMTGTIGKNNLSLTPCTKLSSASILSILRACNKADVEITVTLPKKCINGSTSTETHIANDTELNTAFTTAKANGYTFTFA